ncbi:MAG: hypothetical protein M3N13_04660 [Candidatus Eremiobacteraeota bacterium]|nr:hypothetical protein [Candidatus Eremiobacteraeota bacterium]
MKISISAAACLLAWTLIASPMQARAAKATFTQPRWTRPLTPTAPLTDTAVPVMQPLADGTLLVRSGAGVLAVDARGVTRWSMPNIDDALLVGDAVVFRRSNVVFAVRSRDAGVLWKRPCAKPPYLVAAGDRIVTMCGRLSTILRARDGTVLAQRAVKLATGIPTFRGARPLNDGYVLVKNFFDGAWMGDSYFVVDARTGAFLWSETDFDVVDVTPMTIAITPYPSMLPWGTAGSIVRRSLADGATVDSQTYALPKGTDTVRGKLVMSRAATYVTTMDDTLFRFRRGDTRDPQTLHRGSRLVTVTLGSAAFILVDAANGQNRAVYLDRPADHGAFVMRTLGQHVGRVGVRTPERTDVYVDLGDAVRLGDRVAVPENDVVRLYDEFGAIEMTAKSVCMNPQLAATRTTLFMKCSQPGQRVFLAAFARP